jgi:hypothetical protein
MIKHSRLCTLPLLLAVVTHAGLSSTPPDTIEIRSALIIKAPPGFPDNIARRDPLEAAIVNGTWKAPAAGETVRYNDTANGTWERITAGPAGWYDHPALEGGYVFATVEGDTDAPMLLEAFGNSMVYVNGACRSGNPYATKDRYERWEPRKNERGHSTKRDSTLRGSGTRGTAPLKSRATTSSERATPVTGMWFSTATP